MADETADPFMRLLGIEVLAAGDGSATLRATVREEHLNLHGTTHGGFLYALADAAFALASNSREGAAVALYTSMQYFRAVRAGDVLVAAATEEHLGRRTAAYRVQVLDDGSVVALFNGTVYRLPAS